MTHPFRILIVALAALLSLAWATVAAAYPAVYVGKTAGKRNVKTGHVVLMTKAGRTAITLMADYGGPLDDFAVVVPVPADVTLERVHTLKRDFVDRIDKITAPRFHEFWEKDPCEPGKPMQEWERSMKASAKTDFLGQPMIGGEKKKKVPKEMLLDVDAEFKGTSAEFTFEIVSPDDDVVAWLKGEGYKVDDATAKALSGIGGSGFLVGTVDAKKLELVAGGRAQLSPFRFWTESTITKLHTTLGHTTLKGMQDLVVYVVHPDKRFEAKNYDNVFPPTNIQIADLRYGQLYVKERMTALYAQIHDKLLAKNPKGVLVEWAGTTDMCGQPCATTKLQPFEILSLGADVFEEVVPEEERHPEPPEATEEEENALKAEQVDKSPADKKKIEEQWEERRKELARRKALIARNQYVITRLHHRYDEKTMPADLEVKPSFHVRGGIAIPKGPDGEMDTGFKKADDSFFQVRFTYLHVWKGMQKCEKPERWRWEKAPRTYRGRRKIWVAQDLGTADRDVFPLDTVIKTPIPTIGLSGAAAAASKDAGADAGAGEKADGGGPCGCRTPGGAGRPGPAALVLLLTGFAAARRRRRR